MKYFTYFFIAILLLPTSLAHASTKTTPRAHHYLKVSNQTIHNQGFTPSQIKNAYGISALPQDGLGKTIAIIDAYDSPTIDQDVATFSQTYTLPQLSSAASCTKTCFQIIYSAGFKPKSNADWAQETSLDVEWAHAIAPRATILLVESENDTLVSLMGAVQRASQRGADVISMSWGGTEFSSEKTYDSVFNSSAIYVASSGDNGNGASYPASSPKVLSVGGTTLTMNLNGAIKSESAWAGSGGGVSQFENQPLFQKGLSTLTRRITPDVSYNADPNTGYSIYDSTPNSGISGWLNVGGTSAGAPQWAALIALLEQTSAHITISTLYAHQDGFRDIIKGGNGNCSLCQAKSGFDAVTGLGTPNAATLVTLLR